ncbi:hypothetical protein [Alteromonas sp. KUL49]|uniref:FFLEELY motif protein n=1 Tax=Alteromonas sp. KUL49 TaxID=2480798 RepID=UPI00102F0036|nr:hypothetical protein [Alteromonas sp. KUL49]TAP35460.1 hypothetical protein EYS00_18260 [Alteromonas sp. KUL49]GEA13333.1 hypothetical protein KUL49_37080 [Alteromonas sp. KUL49]
MTQHIVKHIHRVNAQRDMASALGILPVIHSLQNWQCERLLVTHEDLAQQSRYQNAMQFFVDELYGPKDFSQRDADIARVIPKLASVLPQSAMLAMEDALALNALSFELDMKMAQALGDTPITRHSYAQAYREVGTQETRTKQIEIIEHLGAQLDGVVKMRGIGMLISLARRPAKMAGLLTLHEFLERGFKAFKAIGDVHSFIDPVLAKEREIMTILLDEKSPLPDENPLPDVTA